eukprot:m51a1_g3112 hypothetical protein (901) ;mRNA; f:152863-156028
MGNDHSKAAVDKKKLPKCASCKKRVAVDRVGPKAHCKSHCCEMTGCRKARMPSELVSCSPEDGRVFDFCGRQHAEQAPCKLAGCSNRRAVDRATGQIYLYCCREHAAQDDEQRTRAAGVGTRICDKATPGACRLCGAKCTAVNPETGSLFEFCCPQHAREGSPLCPVPHCASVRAANPAGGFFPGCCREHSAALAPNPSRFPEGGAAAAAAAACGSLPSPSQAEELRALEDAAAVVVSGAEGAATVEAVCNALDALEENTSPLSANRGAGVRALYALLGAYAATPPAVVRVMRVLYKAVYANQKLIPEVVGGPAWPALAGVIATHAGSPDVLAVALPLLCLLLPDSRRRLAEGGFARALVDVGQRHANNPRVLELVCNVVFLAAPGASAELLQLDMGRVVYNAAAAWGADADLLAAACRALVGLVCVDEAARAQFSSPQVIAMLEHAAVEYQPYDEMFLQCRDALQRAECDECKSAAAQQLCTVATTPRCGAFCSAAMNLYCQKCCRCQWFHECFTCNTANSRLWICATCARAHHAGHQLSERFFLPGSCSCAITECKRAKTAPASSSSSLPPVASPSAKPLSMMKRTPAATLVKTSLHWDETTLQWAAVEGESSYYESASVPQGSPLWEAIAEQWNRQSPGMPAARKYTITRIEAVSNDMLTTSFNTRGEQLERRRGGESAKMFHFASKDEHQSKVLERLRRLFIPQDQFTKANFVYLWHGCSPAVTKSICLGGLADLRGTDGGYFGGGVYLTPQAQYAALYATGLTNSKPKPTEQGEYTVLMAAGTIGLAYPITRKNDYNYPDLNVPYSVSSFHCAAPISQEAVAAYNAVPKNIEPLRRELKRRDDKALKPAFDTHFIGVSQNWNFQAAPPDQIQYDEIVTNESQVLPLAIVYIKPSQ